MTDYRARLNADPLPWLLERDDEQPGVRLFALRWIEGRAADDPQVVEARAAVMRGGPVPAILAQQAPEGWWRTPDRLYGTKYTSSAWQMPFLAELGADPADERVRAACEWVLDRGPGPAGGIAMTGSQSSVVHCLNGVALRGLIELGYLDDPRTRRALAWATDAILGSGEPEYRTSGTSGPGFSCGVNGGLPCAWGAVKELRALAAIPPRRRSRAVREAIEVGVELLLGADVARAAFPTSTSISRRWFRFGFPSSYSADLLELLLALAELGRARDPRAAPAIELLLSKQDAAGRWRLETTLNGKMCVDIERRGEPSKWLTLRALRVLGAASASRRRSRSVAR